MAATTTFIILMIYVVLSLGGSLAPVPNYRHGNPSMNPSWEREMPNPAMDRTLVEEIPVPKCPSGQEFCENVARYPGDEIRRALKYNSSFSTFFKRRRPQLESVTVKDRYDSRTTGNVDPNEERVCDVQEQIIRPKVATNRNGEKKFIVNEGSDYKQFVKVEKCRNVNESCHIIEGHLSRGFRTVCRQKYFTLLMLSYDEENDELIIDDFEFPLACFCYLLNYV